MKKELKPDWTKEQKEAGKRITQAWEEYFSEAEAKGEIPESPSLTIEESRIAEIRARHEAELLRFPNAVGLDVGIRIKQGKPTGQRCLVVYVEKKVPLDKLEESEVLPRDIEGIPVDVVEIGRVEAL